MKTFYSSVEQFELRNLSCRKFVNWFSQGVLKGSRYLVDQHLTATNKCDVYKIKHFCYIQNKKNRRENFHVTITISSYVLWVGRSLRYDKRLFFASCFHLFSYFSWKSRWFTMWMDNFEFILCATGYHAELLIWTNWNYRVQLLGEINEYFNVTLSSDILMRWTRFNYDVMFKVTI